MKFTTLIASAASIVLGTAVAGAADLPVRAPPPPLAPVLSWTGFYFGANAGYGFGTSNWTDPNNHSGLGSTGDFSLSGFVVGPTLGVNFQTNAFVYGAEADFDGSWIRGGSSSAFCGTNVGFPGGAMRHQELFHLYGTRAVWLCSGPGPVLRHWRRRSRQYFGRH